MQLLACLLLLIVLYGISIPLIYVTLSSSILFVLIRSLRVLLAVYLSYRYIARKEQLSKKMVVSIICVSLGFVILSVLQIDTQLWLLMRNTLQSNNVFVRLICEEYLNGFFGITYVLAILTLVLKSRLSSKQKNNTLS